MEGALEMSKTRQTRDRPGAPQRPTQGTRGSTLSGRTGSTTWPGAGTSHYCLWPREDPRCLSTHFLHSQRVSSSGVGVGALRLGLENQDPSGIFSVPSRPSGQSAAASEGGAGLLPVGDPRGHPGLLSGASDGVGELTGSSPLLASPLSLTPRPQGPGLLQSWGKAVHQTFK